MDLYVILRRNGWATADDLEAAAERSTNEGDKPGSGVRWIRSYVVAEESGELGTFCIYEADSPEAIRAHADASDMPADEIVPVADTVIVRPDPVRRRLRIASAPAVAGALSRFESGVASAPGREWQLGRGAGGNAVQAPGGPGGDRGPCVLAIAPGTAQAYNELNPGGTPKFGERVPVNVVFVGYDQDDAPWGCAPSSRAAGRRRSRAFYGSPSGWGSTTPTTTAPTTRAGVEDGFFSHLSSLPSAAADPVPGRLQRAGGQRPRRHPQQRDRRAKSRSA